MVNIISKVNSEKLKHMQKRNENDSQNDTLQVKYKKGNLGKFKHREFIKHVETPLPNGRGENLRTTNYLKCD